MNKISQVLFLVLIVGLFAGCEEDKKDAFVYGTVEVSPGGTVEFEGTISEVSKTKYYGSCEMKDNKFSFSVGHTDLPGIDNLKLGDTLPLFIFVGDIQGPPVEGVFDLSDETDSNPPPLDVEADYTSLGRVIVKTDKDQWEFASDEANCTIERFATPIDGELIFDNELNKTFDYYVRLECFAIQPLGAEDETLNSVIAELYFENCD